MTRVKLLLTALLALAAAALVATSDAGAHPLGNFTTNRYHEVVVSGDRVYVLAMVDLAEIPTFQARGDVARLGRPGYARSLVSRIEEGLLLTFAGEARALRPVRRSLAFPKAAAGLQTTRLEVVFDAGPAQDGALVLTDESFPGRIGWREIVVSASRGASIRTSSVAAASTSDRLRAYPGDLLRSPLDLRRASATVTAGTEPGVAPVLGGRTDEPVRDHGGFAALIERDGAGAGFVLGALLVAMFWGAAHALTPGHGKALVAAYLVGARGRPRHAFMLGGSVTIAHTAGVFALGIVTLGLSQFILPEQLYPWLTLVSGLLVVVVGASVLRSRLRTRLRRHDHEHGDHHHHHADDVSSKGIFGVGLAAGVLPCPSALVVLLSAIALHRVGLGLALIIAFSIGLAATITGIGLVAVYARRAFGRLSLDGPVVRALPSVSAALIVAVGLVITLRAVPGVV